MVSSPSASFGSPLVDSSDGTSCSSGTGTGSSCTGTGSPALVGQPIGVHYLDEDEDVTTPLLC